MATKFITVSIEIMHDQNLNQSQKFILAEVEQLSQLDKGCIASNTHFSDLIGITKENVSRNINDLRVKGYINIEIVAGTRNHTRIITITTLVRPPYQSSKTPLLKQQETKENKTSNRTINKERVVIDTEPPIKKQKKKAMFTDEDMGLAATMYHNILAMNEGYKKPDLEMWANEFRLMRDIDKRTVEGMDNFLNSLATDDDNMWVFWRGNILSPKSMRKNYDQVVSQYRRDVVDKKKAVNQNIPIADRVKALSNMKKEA